VQGASSTGMSCLVVLVLLTAACWFEMPGLDLDLISGLGIFVGSVSFCWLSRDVEVEGVSGGAHRYEDNE
jgi:hypothetical protein